MVNSVISLLMFCIVSMFSPVEDHYDYNEALVFEVGVPEFLIFGFQLGGLIIVNDSKLVSHEYGHYLQEQQLGIYYLPIIGGSSICGSFMGVLKYVFNKYDNNDYHNIWSEKWADQLGGVGWH